MLVAALVALAATCVAMTLRQTRTITACLLCLMLLAGALRWNVSALQSDREPLRELCRDGSATVNLVATITSVPVAFSKTALSWRVPLNPHREASSPGPMSGFPRRISMTESTLSRFRNSAGEQLSSRRKASSSQRLDCPDAVAI